MELLPKRRRNTYHANEERKLGEKSNGISEIIRLERKKDIYSMQEKALEIMQKVVSEQMMKVEVEGLQLAANIREKEAEEFGVSFDEPNQHGTMENNQPLHDTLSLDDVIKINKHELDLDADLGDLLYNDYCPAAEEEDDEDEIKFQYLQEFKSGVQ